MNWSEKVYSYCERGADPGFWAEPLNAISNASFIAAGLLGLALWRRSENRARTELAMVFLVLAIGAGSFLFHTFATRWARIADSGPIAIFMVFYLAYAIRRFLNANWIVTGIAVFAFLASSDIAGSIRCGGEGSPVCLNGSAGYLPALAALVLVFALLNVGRHGGAAYLGAGSAVFALSLAFRSVDLALCPLTLIRPGWHGGTHAVWHILNGILLYVLLAAAIRHGRAKTGASLSTNK